MDTQQREVTPAASATASPQAPRTPRRRIAKLLEAVGLGDYEPEAIAELHVRERFGGRPLTSQQKADQYRFAYLTFLGYGIETHGLDIPADSYHRPIFDALDLEQIEELLLLHSAFRDLVHGAERRVRAVAEHPLKLDVRVAALMGRAPWKTSRSATPSGRERRPACNQRTRGSRRSRSSSGSRSSGSSDEPGESHSVTPKPFCHPAGRRVDLWKVGS